MESQNKINENSLNFSLQPCSRRSGELIRGTADIERVEGSIAWVEFAIGLQGGT